jgi:hypothetical protein
LLGWCASQLQNFCLLASSFFSGLRIDTAAQEISWRIFALHLHVAVTLTAAILRKANRGFKVFHFDEGKLIRLRVCRLIYPLYVNVALRKCSSSYKLSCLHRALWVCVSRAKVRHTYWMGGGWAPMELRSVRNRTIALYTFTAVRISNSN